MFKTLRRDLEHHLSGSHYSTPVKLTTVRLLRSLITPEFRVIVRYRFCHYLHRKGFRILSFYFYQGMKRRYNCDISPECIIGPGLRIVHASDIVIGPGVIIGTDVVLFNGVTLGNKNIAVSGTQMPKVGDRVTISTGAKILGAIELGNDAIVGANAVVLYAVQNGTTVVGVPARPLSSIENRKNNIN